MLAQENLVGRDSAESPCRRLLHDLQPRSLEEAVDGDSPRSGCEAPRPLQAPLRSRIDQATDAALVANAEILDSANVEVDREAEPATLLTRSQWRCFLELLSIRLAQVGTLERLDGCRGSLSNWGSWRSFSTDSRDVQRVLAVRGTSTAEENWPEAVRNLRLVLFQEVFQQLKIRIESRSHADITFRTNFRMHCAAPDLLAALTYHDLLLLSGRLEIIPVDVLEVAWVLRLYPGQISSMIQSGMDELTSVSVLRKAINQVIGSAAQEQKKGGEEDSSLVHMLPLSRRSESDLILLGYRAINALNLQEIVCSCSQRLWRNNRGARIDVHKGLIVAGACGAETLHSELKATTEVDLPEEYSKCRLNAAFRSMGLPLITPDASLVMRARAREYASKACLLQLGLAPLLATAPHNIVLVRDGRPPHKMEEHTTFIADRIAARLGGTSLTWSRREQYRTELHWAMAKRRGMCRLEGNMSGLLDASNRDPNYLTADEVEENDWFRKMDFMRRRAQPKDKVVLHVDVHGCRGPPHHPAHLNVGLGAMRQHMKDDIHTCIRFGELLRLELVKVIGFLTLQPAGKSVAVVVPEDPEDPPKLSGAWKPSMGRYTQTQQAMSFAKFTHSVQLEFSKSLRRALFDDKDTCDRLADAIWQAFIRLQGGDSVPAGFS